MKISIDTKEDSPEEIRKLIRMLLALVGDSSGYEEKASPATGEGLFDMFGDPQASTAEQQQNLFGEKGLSKNEQQQRKSISSSQIKMAAVIAGIIVLPILAFVFIRSRGKGSTGQEEAPEGPTGAENETENTYGPA